MMNSTNLSVSQLHHPQQAPPCLVGRLYFLCKILIAQVHLDSCHEHVGVLMKVQDVELCLSFALVCAQLCVFFPFKDAYSVDLKLSPHEVWLLWWNLSTVICNFMNRWVSLFSPNSLLLQALS